MRQKDDGGHASRPAERIRGGGADLITGNSRRFVR